MAENKLIKLTEQKIGDNTALSTFVNQAKELTICLFPETVHFTDPALKFGAALVSVDLHLDRYGNNKDIYRNESGSYCLHLSKKNEISQHANIHIVESKVQERKVDEHGRVVFVQHMVRGKMKYVDGSIKEITATGTYDYYRDCEKYISKKDGKPLTNMINSRRSHAAALAESNAIDRLYGKLNFKLPSSFTLEELKKPFLVPFVIEDKEELLKGLPEADQIALKKEVARKRLGLTNDIYSAPETKQIGATTPTESKTPTNPNIEDANFTEEPNSKEEENKIIAKEFREVPQKERTKKILNLIKLKGWKHPKGAIVTAAMIEKAPIDVQIARLEELLNMPEVEEEVSL